MSLESDTVQIYRACLKHTLYLASVFLALVLGILVLFGFYISKSFETEPQTITATQSNFSGDNSISQGD